MSELASNQLKKYFILIEMWPDYICYPFPIPVFAGRAHAQCVRICTLVRHAGLWPIHRMHGYEEPADRVEDGELSMKLISPQTHTKGN